MRLIRYAPYTALLLLLSACTGDAPSGSGPDVSASGKGAIAAGRDVRIDKRNITNEYDKDEARRIEAKRFASAMHRECTEFVETARGLTLVREEGDQSDATIPAIFSPQYAAMETQRIFGEKVYQELNTQREELTALRGSIFNMRQQYAMSSVFQMMAQYSKRAKNRAQQMPAAPTEEQFASTKTKFVEKTEAHCEYLRSLT